MAEELKNCPHCGAPESDLEDSTMRMAHMGNLTWEEPFEKRMVYCTNCGHYGDEDTWDNRPETTEACEVASESTGTLREGVDTLRNALREPERV